MVETFDVRLFRLAPIYIQQTISADDALEALLEAERLEDADSFAASWKTAKIDLNGSGETSINVYEAETEKLVALMSAEEIAAKGSAEMLESVYGELALLANRPSRGVLTVDYMRFVLNDITERIASLLYIDSDRGKLLIGEAEKRSY